MPDPIDQLDDQELREAILDFRAARDYYLAIDAERRIQAGADPQLAYISAQVGLISGLVYGRILDDTPTEEARQVGTMVVNDIILGIAAHVGQREAARFVEDVRRLLTKFPGPNALEKLLQ